jgi:oligopeptide/dipeptide ABC transporter ATP-binding protein
MSALIEARDLKKYFTIRGAMGGSRVLKAVDGVSLSIEKGETFGLVGESGCGKTTLGRTMIRLYDVTGGTLKFDGADITNLNGKALAPYRQRMQIIFQDPYSSLNPFMNVEELISEPLNLREKLSKSDRRDRVMAILQKVGMDESALEKYPHEFSGGQRQRIGIARALVVRPDFVLCDEPISALDVSIQAQVVNMLEDLQAEMGLTYLFVAHDLSMVRHISRRIGVMYLGHMVEISPSKELYRNPLHPYTQALLSAIPIPDPQRAKEVRRIALTGDVPSPSRMPTGCPFQTRCPHAMPKCREVAPELREVSPGHQVACFLQK